MAASQMAPFLASPRKAPHIQMAHYSSIWLCILLGILFQCLTTSISNTGGASFQEASLHEQSEQPGSSGGFDAALTRETSQRHAGSDLFSARVAAALFFPSVHLSDA